MLATDCDSTWIIANRLRDRFPVQGVVIESPVSRSKFLQRRVRRLGYMTVAGQIAFQLFSRVLTCESRQRRDEIRRRNGWKRDRPSQIPCFDVSSVNDNQTLELLSRLKPKVIVINGTRILSKRLLQSLDVPILNLHAGITPAYRGVHGAYWAFARDDAAHAGVTVHRVDPGIDTGDVVFQATIQRAAADNYATYPLLQLEAGMHLLESAVADALNHRIRSQQTTGLSELFYHPTIWGYLRTRLTQGIK